MTDKRSERVVIREQAPSTKAPQPASPEPKQPSPQAPKVEIPKVPDLPIEPVEDVKDDLLKGTPIDGLL